MIRARPPVQGVPAPDDGGEVVGGAGVPDFGERLTQAHPVKPEDLRRGADGMLVFWIDNQHGYYWAADPDSVKHQVFDRTNTSAEWKPTGESVERFLLHRTVHEALVGTGNKFSAVVPTEVLGSGVLDSCASFPFTPAVHDAPSTPVAVQRRRPGEGGPATGWLCPARPGELMLTVAATPGIDLGRYRAVLEPHVLERPRRVVRPSVAPPF
ncbi:hypothetical protein AB0907_38635 [Streptomyces sp. NPDC006975]|uniref:hypothetical protein n=1 Tax=Streptomyces sp. NPDC006975 TaxID=3154310 RepID=UPI003453EA5C